MRPVRWLGPALLVLGVSVLALAVSRQEARLYLVVFVPVVAATGAVAFLGILLVFAGFFLTFLLWPSPVESRAAESAVVPGPPETAQAGRRWGGVLFLGPVPLIFGSDSRMAKTMLLVGIVLFLALLALTVLALFA